MRHAIVAPGSPPAVILGFELNGLGVARALSRHGVNVNNYGDAKYWDDHARQHGYRVDNTPSPGAFTFRRHGMGWKLEAVRLEAIAPRDFLSAPSPAEPPQGRQ